MLSWLSWVEEESKVPDNGVVSAVNSRIRAFAGNFEGLNRSPIEFLCECGCGEEVPMTVEDYDSAGGAWIEGHAPHPDRRGSEAA